MRRFLFDTRIVQVSVSVYHMRIIISVYLRTYYGIKFVRDHRPFFKSDAMLDDGNSHNRAIREWLSLPRLSGYFRSHRNGPRNFLETENWLFSVSRNLWEKSRKFRRVRRKNSGSEISFPGDSSIVSSILIITFYIFICHSIFNLEYLSTDYNLRYALIWR